MSRLRSGTTYALVAGAQMAMFTSSFFVIREGYRHLLKVKQAESDWYVLNSLSMGTGAGLFGMVRMGWNQKVFVKSFVSGCIMGIGLSVIYVGASSALRAYIQKSRAEEGFDLAEKIPQAPQWFPFRKLDKEEVAEKKREAS